MVRLWPLVLLTTAVLAFTACEDAQEVLPSTSATAEPSAVGAVSPSPAPSPSATVTVAPTDVAGCPEIKPDMTMLLTGPAQANPREQVTYRLTYELTGLKGTEVRFAWGAPGVGLEDVVPFVSSARLSGTGAPAAEATLIDGRIWQVTWGVEEGNGEIEVTLQIPDSPTFSSMRVFAYVPGTCAPASNPAETKIIPNAQ